MYPIYILEDDIIQQNRLKEAINRYAVSKQWGDYQCEVFDDGQELLTAFEKSGEKAPLILILNNRKDRPARALEMSRLARLLPVREIWILGEQKGLMQRLLRRQNPSVPLRRFDRAEDIPLDFTEPRVLLGAGNIKGQGEALTLRIRRRAKEVE